MTAPALYRYAASHEDLILMVALNIDGEVGRRITAAADTQPAGDTAARMVAAAVEFRQWALANREEFALVFTNVDVECLEALNSVTSVGVRFSEMLFELWAEKQFPIPALDDLDP